MGPTPPASEALLEHARFVRSLALRLVHGGADADDAAQETWLAALERPPLRATNPRGWLARVLQRAVARTRAAERRRAHHERRAARPERLPSAADGALRAAVLAEVAQAVLELEEPYRTTLLQRFYEELDVAAIAARSGAPRATVQSRLRRALARLRERLDARHGGDRERWVGALAALARPTPIEAQRSGDEAPPTGPQASSAAAPAPAGLVAQLALGALAVATAVLVWRALPRNARGEGAPRPAVELASTSPDARLGEEPPSRPELSAAAPEREARAPDSARDPVAAADGVPVRGRVLGALDPHPVRGAAVRAHRWDGARWEELAPAVSTGEDGVFRLRLARGAPCRLDVAAAGFLATFLELVPDELLRYGGGSELELAPIELAPALRLEGRVLREDGAPISGTASVYAADGGGQYLVYLGESEAGGGFAFDDPLLSNPEHVRLVAFAEGTFGWSEDEHVVYGEGVRAGFEIVLPSPESLGALEVTVVEGGVPVAGASVELTPSEANQWWSVHGRFAPIGPDVDLRERARIRDGGRVNELVRRTTDAHGRARFDGLPCTSPTAGFDLVCRAPPERGGAVREVQAERAGTPEPERVLIELAAEEEALLAGRVTARDGRGIAGARLGVGAWGGKSVEDGAFELRVSPRETVTLEVSADGWIPQELDVELRPDGVEGLHVVLEPALPIQGRVVDQHGVPVAGALVDALQGDVRRRASEYTGADGRFRCGGTGPGTWELEARAPEGEWRDEQARASAAAGSQDVVLVLQRLPEPRGRLDVRVVRRGSEESVPLRTVDVERVPGTGDPATEDHGPRVLPGLGRAVVTRLHVGTWTLRVEEEHQGRLLPLPSVTFEITPEQPEHALELEAAPFLGFATLVAALEPEAAAALDPAAVLDGGDFELEWYPNAGCTLADWRRYGGELDGARWVSEPLPPGFARLLLCSEDAGLSGVVEAELRAPGETHVRLEAAPLGRLAFLGEESVPGLQVHIEVQRRGGPRDLDFELDTLEDARWFELGLHPGAYEWRVHFLGRADEGPRLASQSGEALVETGRVTEVLVALLPAPDDESED